MTPINITVDAGQALTNMAQPERGRRLTPNESDALGALTALRGAGLQVVYGHNPLGALAAPGGEAPAVFEVPPGVLPACPKCGDNRQVWANQITGLLTCHRAHCHTVVTMEAGT